MKAFTLMELLVTMSVVGVLSSMSVTSFNEFKRHAYMAELAVVGGQLPLGVEAFYLDRIRGGDIVWTGVANTGNDYDTRARVHANVPGMSIPRRDNKII